MAINNSSRRNKLTFEETVEKYNKKYDRNLSSEKRATDEYKGSGEKTTSHSLSVSQDDRNNNIGTHYGGDGNVQKQNTQSLNSNNPGFSSSNTRTTSSALNPFQNTSANTVSNNVLNPLAGRTYQEDQKKEEEEKKEEESNTTKKGNYNSVTNAFPSTFGNYIRSQYEKTDDEIIADYEALPSYNWFQTHNIFNPEDKKEKKQANNYKDAQYERYVDAKANKALNMFAENGVTAQDMEDFSNYESENHDAAVDKIYKVMRENNYSGGEEEMIKIFAQNNDYYRQKYAMEHPVESTLQTVFTKPIEDMVEGVIPFLGDYLQGNPINLGNKSYQVTRDAISQSIQDNASNPLLGQLGSFGYGTLTSMADMALAQGIGLATGNNMVAPIIMGLEKASDTLKDAEDRGLSADTAAIEGALSGVTTFVTEKIPMDNLSEFMTKGFDKNFATTFWKQFLAEGGQEAAENVSDTLVDAMLAYDKSKIYNTYQNYLANNGGNEKEAIKSTIYSVGGDILTDFLGGGLAGGIMGGTAGAIGSNANIQQNFEQNNGYNPFYEAGTDIQNVLGDVSDKINGFKKNQEANKEAKIQDSITNEEPIAKPIVESTAETSEEIPVLKQEVTPRDSIAEEINAIENGDLSALLKLAKEQDANRLAEEGRTMRYQEEQNALNAGSDDMDILRQALETLEANGIVEEKTSKVNNVETNNNADIYTEEPSVDVPTSANPYGETGNDFFSRVSRDMLERQNNNIPTYDTSSYDVQSMWDVQDIERTKIDTDRTRAILDEKYGKKTNAEIWSELESAGEETPKTVPSLKKQKKKTSTSGVKNASDSSTRGKVSTKVDKRIKATSGQTSSKPSTTSPNATVIPTVANTTNNGSTQTYREALRENYDKSTTTSAGTDTTPIVAQNKAYYNTLRNSDFVMDVDQATRELNAEAYKVVGGKKKHKVLREATSIDNAIGVVSYALEKADSEGVSHVDAMRNLASRTSAILSGIAPNNAGNGTTETDVIMNIAAYQRSIGDIVGCNRTLSQLVKATTDWGRNIQALAKYSRTSLGLQASVMRQMDNIATRWANTRTNFSKGLKSAIESAINGKDGSVASLLNNAINDNNIKLKEGEFEYILNSIQGNRDINDILNGIYTNRATGGVGYFEISADDLEFVTKKFDEANNLVNGSKEWNDVVEEAYKRLAKYCGGASFTEKWDAWRYLCMLGNPKTHVRNIAGNTVMFGTATAKDVLATSMESLYGMYAEKTGKEFERSKSILTANDNELFTQSMKDANGEPYSELMSSDKYNIARGMDSQKRIFDLAPAEGASKLNNFMLTAEDNGFLKPGYAKALAGYLKANNKDTSIFGISKQLDEAKIKYKKMASDPNTSKQDLENQMKIIELIESSEDMKLLKRAREYAIKEAKENTFHDETELGKLFKDLSTKFKNMSKQKGSKGVFGKALNMLFEGVVPFKSTTAAVAQRAIDYSPAGLVNGVIKTVQNGIDSKNNSDMTYSVNEVVNTYAKGLTGSAVGMLGFFLTKAGFLRAAGGDDDKKNKLDKLVGHQDYSMVVPLGDKTVSYTLDWLSPISIPLFMGVTLAEAFDDGKINKDDILNMFMGSTQPFFEMSMIQGINDVLNVVKNADDEDRALATVLNAGLGYITQGIPTIVGQVNRGINNTRKSTYADSSNPFEKVLDTHLKKVQNKIAPWSSEDYINEYGESEKNNELSDNVFANIAYQMFSPGYISVIDSEGIGVELNNLYDEGKDAGLNSDELSKFVLGNYDKDISVKTDSGKTDFEGKPIITTESRKFTEEERNTYSKVYGTTRADMLSYFMNSDYYDGLSIREKSKSIEKITTFANKYAKVYVADMYGIDGYDPNYEESSEAEIYRALGEEGFASYSAVKAKLNTISEDGNHTNKEKMDAIDSVEGLSDETKGLFTRYMLQSSGKLTDTAEKAVELFGSDVGAYYWYDGIKNAKSYTEKGTLNEATRGLSILDSDFDDETKIALLTCDGDTVLDKDGIISVYNNGGIEELRNVYNSANEMVKTVNFTTMDTNGTALEILNGEGTFKNKMDAIYTIDNSESKIPILNNLVEYGGEDAVTDYYTALNMFDNNDETSDKFAKIESLGMDDEEAGLVMASVFKNDKANAIGAEYGYDKAYEYMNVKYKSEGNNVSDYIDTIETLGYNPDDAGIYLSNLLTSVAKGAKTAEEAFGSSGVYDYYYVKENAYDIDGDGKITKDEKAAFAQVKLGLSEVEARYLASLIK